MENAAYANRHSQYTLFIKGSEKLYNKVICFKNKQKESYGGEEENTKNHVLEQRFLGTRTQFLIHLSICGL